MPVTELALLRVVPPLTVSSPTLLEHLKIVKDGMESFSGMLFSYYQCLEDLKLVFLVGGWPSAQMHWEERIPSEENQKLLTLLKGEVEVEYMFHVDVDRRDLEGVDGSKVMAIARHTIKADGRVGFEKRFGEVKGSLEKVIGKREKVKGGWRVEKGFVKGEEPVMEGMAGEKDEWVLFTGWESKDAHMAFVQTKDFEEYGRIREWVGGYDVKHGVKMAV